MRAYSQSDQDRNLALLNLVSLIAGLPEAQRQVFLALYMVMGEDLLLLFYELKGQTVKFPTSRVYAESVAQIEDSIQIVDDCHGEFYTTEGLQYVSSWEGMHKGDHYYLGKDGPYVELLSSPIQIDTVQFLMYKELS